MPILVLHGTRDRLTAPAGSRALVARAPSSHKGLIIYEGFFHDLLHEPAHERVEDDIVSWIDRAAAQAVPTDGKGSFRGLLADAAARPGAAKYSGELAGEPRGWTQAVELSGGVADGSAAAGQLEVSLARPRPIGWHGALTARLAGDYRALALRPLGIAVRAGAAMAGISAGGALLFGTGTHVAAAAGAVLEVPLGPVHASATGEWARASAAPGPLGSTQLWLGGSLRVGGDRTYWPNATAGVGPVVGGGVAWLGDTHAWVLTAGIELYGAD